MNAHLKAELLVDCQNDLGEAVQWNSFLQKVFWTDVFGNALWSCNENGDEVSCQKLPGKLCSFAFRSDGGLLAAFSDGIYDFDIQSGQRRLLAQYQPELGRRTRMNDGGVDRCGRFLAGGIDEEGMHPITEVWSISGCEIRTVISSVGCANSITFSPDGDTMYFADSRCADIFAFDYDQDSGMPSNKRLFASLRDGEGKPDGSCVDREGALWNAQFGGGAVQRFLENGERSTRVELDVPNVTCCCIGGKNLDVLFITTASSGMRDFELQDKPHSGGLFVCPIGAIGLPASTFGSGQKLPQPVP
ncbi:MAG: SMP-30/gluconolactonase/LRE family protein [Pseudomonadota bacterium]